MSSIYLAGSGQTVANVSVDYPRPDRLVSGNPKRLTYDLYQHPAMNCGIWECEVGSWNIQFSPHKQEFLALFTEKYAFMMLNQSNLSRLLPVKRALFPKLSGSF